MVKDCAHAKPVHEKNKSIKNKVIKDKSQPSVIDQISVAIMNSNHYVITQHSNHSWLFRGDWNSGGCQAPDVRSPHHTEHVTGFAEIPEANWQTGLPLLRLLMGVFTRLSSKLFVLLGWSVHWREVRPAGTVWRREVWRGGALDCLWIGTLWDYVLVERTTLCTHCCEVIHSSSGNDSFNHHQGLTHNAEQAVNRVLWLLDRGHEDRE